MKEIGNQLKEAREKKKLSIHDVAIATKINNKIITAIENGDEDTLPAKPFLRGFVQTYARYLELNVDDVMKRFLEAHGSTKPKPQITEDGTSSQVSHEEVQNKFEMYKKIAYTVAAIVAIVFIYFIQKVVSKYEQESKIAKEQKEVVKSQLPTEIVETPATPTTEGPINDPNTAVTTPAEVKTDIKPIEVKPEETKPEEKKPEPKLVEAIKPPLSPTPLVTAPAAPVIPPKPSAPAVVAPLNPIEIKPAEVKPVEEKKIVAGKPQQLIIEALDNVEIRYSKDGESERTVKLKPEQFLTIKAGTKINLNVSDSGAINIIHNGRDKGVPGNLGQPTKISYP
ncbi:MAG: helix-turn-helix domain-containing protein [Bdellovibrionota bacterium]